MITEQQILEATEETLPRLAGEVLQPEKNKHKWPPHNTTICLKCHERLRIYSIGHECDIDTKAKGLPCIVADIVPLTWDNAMKWRDWAIEKWGEAYDQALESMWHSDLCKNKCHVWSFAEWLIHARPIHYIKAAAICNARVNS